MYRMIYKSRSVAPLDWELIRSIATQSELSNEKRGLTGVLLASKTHFLQVIEGRFEEINAVFRKICRDERHDELSIVSFSIIDSQLFGGWGMQGIGVFDLNTDIEAQMKRKYGEEQGGIRFPLEEWSALALVNDIKMVYNPPEWKR